MVEVGAKEPTLTRILEQPRELVGEKLTAHAVVWDTLNHASKNQHREAAATLHSKTQDALRVPRPLNVVDRLEVMAYVYKDMTSKFDEDDAEFRMMDVLITVSSSENEPQTLAMLALTDQADERCLDIESVAAHPEAILREQPWPKGAGRQAIAMAVQLSVAMGYEGELIVNPHRDAKQWYWDLGFRRTDGASYRLYRDKAAENFGPLQGTS